MLAVVLLLVGSAMAFAAFEPIQVLPRMELAPGFAFVDQHGALATSEDGRGAVTLYSFAPTDCGAECAETFAAMAEVQRRAPAEVTLPDLEEPVEFRLVTIALDPIDGSSAADMEALETAAEQSGADGDRWRWMGGDEVTVANAVGLGFSRYRQVNEDGSIDFDGGFVLVDGEGIVRGDYRYDTLADNADKLIRHLNLLADEIENQNGVSSVAYEAAHLFLCYP